VVPASHRKVKNLLGLIEAVHKLSSNEKQKIIIDWYGDKNADIYSYDLYCLALKKIEAYNLQSVIYLHSPTNNISAIIQNADFVGLFSFHEGFPNSVCEGMACGKPIIVTKVSDIPVIIEDGIGGFLCNAEDVDSITETLKKAIYLSQNDFIKMGNYNLIRAKELFYDTANDYLTLFQL
jgi:glycosyltransferase involved in cell wall biosynthesis